MGKILEIGNIFVKDVFFSFKTVIDEGDLFINERALTDLVLGDSRIKNVDVQIAKPGDSTRIVCVKDIVPIRRKIHRNEKRGEGRTQNLANVAVLTNGQIIAGQEGILDMSSKGAKYSPFSKMTNICLNISARDGVIEYEHEKAVRLAGLRAADYLGGVLDCVEADEVEVFEFNPLFVDPKLPRVVYVYTLLLQDLLHHNYINGHDPKKEELLPCVVENPLELLDGLIVSGNCVSACDKSTTWHHWNNAIVREAFKRCGSELNFVGVVLSGLMTSMDEKEEMAERAVRLVKKYKPHVAILSKEGFGNPDADMMLITRFLEKAGIKTVSLHDEWPGSKGISPPLRDTTPEADAMISTGNANELILLPSMDKTIGPLEKLTRLAGTHSGSSRKDGSIEVEIEAILGSTHQFGDMNLMCEEV